MGFITLKLDGGGFELKSPTVERQFPSIFRGELLNFRGANVRSGRSTPIISL